MIKKLLSISWVNKYTIGAGIVIVAIIALNIYTNGKVTGALNIAKNEAVIAWNEFIREDIKDGQQTSENNGALSDSELDDSLCGGKPCSNESVSSNSQLSGKLEAATSSAKRLSVDPQIITRVQTRPQEQQRQSIPVHEKVQRCTEIETLFCINNCCGDE